MIRNMLLVFHACDLPSTPVIICAPYNAVPHAECACTNMLRRCTAAEKPLPRKDPTCARALGVESKNSVLAWRMSRELVVSGMSGHLQLSSMCAVEEGALRPQWRCCAVS